ncbi:MAG: trypsin-like peptidase domain-containing protein [Bacteroidales bacterium]|nr:trypsin-like peptidase domain-containing protein [Bacteroidales bacterium]
MWKNKKGMTPMRAVVVAVALFVMAVSGNSVYAQNRPDFVDAAEASVNAVVHIKTTMIQKTAVYDNFFGFFDPFFSYPGQTQTSKVEAYGSGVVISPDGYIVTNNHVVDGASNVEVTFNNKMVRKATIVGTDPTSDLALIKVDASGLDYLVFGDSDKVKVGEWVLAVGNPFNLTSTVTAGIVSAKARNIGILGEGSNVESFIQTDAAVNRGNSGGALVNTRGELIGINAAIASHTGSYEGYSFAIPSNIVRKVVDDLLMYGQTQRAYIGIYPQEMDASLAEKARMKDIKGVYVKNVTNEGAAQKAGIKAGDVLTSINGNEVNTITQLLEAVNQYRPGDKVNVDVVRSGKKLSFTLSLLNESGSTDVVKKGESFFNSSMGLVLQPISKSEMNNLHIKSGLKIIEIRQGPFQGSGVEGYIISAINGKSVSSKSELESALANNKTRRVYIEGVYPNGMKMNFEYYN